MGRVNPGESTRGKQSAALTNTLQEVARDYRDERAAIPGGFGAPGGALVPATSIFAYRDVDDDVLPRHSPVKLRWDAGADELGADPTAMEPAAYMRRPTAFALSPEEGDSDAPVGIVAETLSPGGFGRVYTAGVCLAVVNLLNATDRAAVLGTSATALDSAGAGPVEILWPGDSESETGERLCLVRLGGHSPPGVVVDAVHVVNVYDPDDPETLIGWQCERVTLGVGAWPPVVADPPVAYPTVFESENREPRLRDEPGDDATHIIPLYRDAAGNYFIVFWAVATGYTEDVVAYSFNPSTCVLSTTTTNYTVALTVTAPGDQATGLTLTRFVTPP